MIDEPIMLRGDLLALAAGFALSLLTAWAAAAPGQAAIVSTDATTSASVDASEPADLVETTAGRISASIELHGAEYHRDPAKLRQLVNCVLLPHVDTAYAARIVLGRSWRNASAAERHRFAAALYVDLEPIQQRSHRFLC